MLAAALDAAISPENRTGRTVAALPASAAAPGSMDGSDGIRPSFVVHRCDVRERGEKHKREEEVRHTPHISERRPCAS